MKNRLAVFLLIAVSFCWSGLWAEQKTETFDIILSSAMASQGNAMDYELTTNWTTQEITNSNLKGRIVRLQRFKTVDNLPDESKFQYNVFLERGHLYLRGKSNGQPGLIRARIFLITED